MTMLIALAIALHTAPMRVQTTREIVIVGTPPAMHCGSPRPLVQGSGTVRTCEVSQ